MGEKANHDVLDKLEVKSRETNFFNDDLSLNENQDEYILSSIFPPEIWSIILVDKVGANCKNGADNLTNCFMASTYFQNLLANKRKFFLFPKVMEILAVWFEDQEAKLDKNNSGSTSSESEDKNEDSPPIFKLTDILICREVCHKWKNFFDKYYQNSNRYSLMHHEKNKLSRNLCEINICHESSDEEEDHEGDKRDRKPMKFINHFAKTHGGPPSKINPFPARAITFGQAHLKQRRAFARIPLFFYHEIAQLLSIYGDFLWHCNIKLTEWSLGSRMFYFLRFHAWLSSMPNLKTLKINCYRTEFIERESDTEQTARMQRISNRSPLPEFKNLQFLQVQDLEPIIFNEIIRKSVNTITKLDIVREKLANSAGNYDIYSGNHFLLHLKELSISFHSVKQFEQMENSEVAGSWKLEAFHFLYNNHAKFIEWSRVFNMISSKWAGTITNLTLQMPVFESDAEKDLGLEVTLSETALQLPFLKRVRLDIKDPCSIDFLLPSINTLESMEINVKYNVDEEKGKYYYKLLKQRQCVKFLGFEKLKRKFARKMLEKFPNLNFLRKITLSNHGDPDADVYEADLIKIKARLRQS